jgi:hypothetical protein
MRAERPQRELGPLVRHVAGGPPAPPELVERFDADGDGDVGLGDLAAAVRSRGKQPPERPPNPVIASPTVRSGKPVRIAGKTPFGDDVVVVAATPGARARLPARRVSDTEIEVDLPPDAVGDAGLVEIWLSRDGVAAGPAVVRVLRGPQVHSAAWVSESHLRIEGEGFGSEASRVTVDVDGDSVVPKKVSDERIEVEVEPKRRRASWVIVSVGEERSRPVLSQRETGGAA